jgi:hypothetical protein
MSADRNESVVAILGCGPAGMMAAHAVQLLGKQPIIYSERAEPSRIPGAAYLHKPMPDINDPMKPHGMVSFIKLGSRDGYAAKVYDRPSAPCSWDQFEEGERPAWSLVETYERLWKMYSGFIIPHHVTAVDLEEMKTNYPLIISTIPKMHLCVAQHEFSYKTVWIRPVAQPGTEPNSMVYNGRPSEQWYRSSLLFGHGSTEFPRIPTGYSFGNVVEGKKPLQNNCDCHPEIVRVGRFGEWRKGVLSHTAFERTMRAGFEAFEGN